MSTKTYDPKLVLVTFGGVPISGFADGTFVNITASGERFTKQVGADGEVVRSRSRDDTYEVTLTLMRSSPSNASLSTIAELDRLTNGGVRPLTVTDLNGNGIHFWPQAWIAKSPDVEFGKESGEQAWVLHTGQVAEAKIGGEYLQ